jgi:hypothetical protein
MIGMSGTVMRGHASQDVIKTTWLADRIHIPKGLGLGLMLQEVRRFECFGFGKNGCTSSLVVDQTSVRYGGSFQPNLPNQTEPNRFSTEPNLVGKF